MALKPPDMESCDTKQRCLTGANKGLAYDPSDPCPSGYEFNPVACDCTITANTWGVCATYADACTLETACRCNVFGTDEKGVPTIEPESIGSNECLLGNWNISFRATFQDQTSTVFNIASGVNSNFSYLVSYQVVYDLPGGGYPCS